MKDNIDENWWVRFKKIFGYKRNNAKSKELIKELVSELPENNKALTETYDYADGFNTAVALMRERLLGRIK
jgi:hypothetical protein